MDVLVQIKRLVLRGDVRFTEKARDEMDADGLRVTDVLESVMNAQAIAKTLKSTSSARRRSGEKLYVIKSFSYEGTIVRENGHATFYIFISSKLATLGE